MVEPHPYVITKSDGAVLTTIYPYETSGPGGESTPFQAVAGFQIAIISATAGAPGAGYFVVAGDVEYLFNYLTGGFKFTVTAGPNAGNYTVGTAVYNGTNTQITVTAGTLSTQAAVGTIQLQIFLISGNLTLSPNRYVSGFSFTIQNPTPGPNDGSYTVLPGFNAIYDSVTTYTAIPVAGPIPQFDGSGYQIVYSIGAPSVLVMVGQDSLDWGQDIWEDMVRMVEHFADPIQPDLNPNIGTNTSLAGQLWYNTSSLDMIETLGAVTGGTGYTAGIYTGVPLTGGTGTGAVGTVIVTGGSPVIDLGTSVTYGVIAASTITSTGATTITGNVGLSPAGSITGSPTVIGTIHNGDVAAATALSDANNAFVAGNALVGFVTIGAALGSTSPAPGYYTTGSSFNITGTVTLNGSATDVWVFKSPSSTLITAASSQVVLTGGALAQNVYWLVGSSATLGTGSTFVGTIIAQASITDNGSSSVDGHMFALTAAVTLNDTTITATPAGSGSGGSVTSVTLTTPGMNYTVGDVLSALSANIGGTGSGFSVPVAAVTGNGVYEFYNGSVWSDLGNALGTSVVLSVTSSGAGISAVTTSGNVVVSNTGVTSLIAGTGISLSSATGAVTITNTGSGSVTSVAATSSTPIGLTIAGTPITTAGTLAFALNIELEGLAQLSTNGFVQRTGPGAYVVNNLTSGQVTTALGFTPYNATNPAGYLTGNQNIVVSGDATGSGNIVITLTLKTVNSTVGTFGTGLAVPQIVVNGKGQVTHAANLAITSASATSAGIVPASGGGTTNYLRSDFTWENPGTAGFSESFTTNGYVKMPNGFYIQWGLAGPSPGSSVTITFPIAFPNACLAINATASSSANGTINVSLPASSRTNFVLDNGASGDYTSWTAYGY